MEELNKNQSVMRSIRFPTFLDDEVNDKIKLLAKVRNISDAYRYFVDLGLKVFEQHTLISSDPERAVKARNQIDSIFGQEDMVKAVRDLKMSDPKMAKALAMAVEFAEMGGTNTNV